MKRALRWFAFIVVAPVFSAIGLITAMAGPEKRRAFLADDFGLSHPSMDEAWDRVLANPFSPHDWKNVIPTWMEINQERPSKWFSFWLVFWFGAALASWTI